MQLTETGIAGNADAGADLDGVLALGPGEIIQEMVYGHLEIVTVGKTGIEGIKSVPRQIGIPHKAGALAGESPTECVDHAVADQRGIAQGHAFAEIYKSLFRRIIGQERSLRIEKILDCPAPEKCLRAFCREVVIDAGDVGVVVEVERRPPAKSGIVEAIANGKIVTGQVSVGNVEILDHVGIGGDWYVERIEAGNLCRIETKKTRGVIVRLAAYSGDASTWARYRVGGSVSKRGALIQHYAITQRGSRNITHDALLFAQARTFVVVEKEKAVFVVQA